jgi:trehalose 6-phosphate synthase
VLWPILHYRVDLQEYSRSDASGYVRVNHLFADHLSALINEDDVIWVHDYHLMVLARELRSRGHRNRIGFFLHTPCAPPDILQTLPHHTEAVIFMLALPSSRTSRSSPSAGWRSLMKPYSAG